MTGGCGAARHARLCLLGYNAFSLKKKTTLTEKSKPKLVIEKSAGAVVFYRSAQVEYLLLRANYWEFPKGLVDAHESELDAAVREVREETGLAITLLPDFRETIQYFYRRKESGGLVKKQVVYFLGEAQERAYRVSWEHQEARWVTFEQAMELLEYENAREILTKAHTRVNKDKR